MHISKTNFALAKLIKALSDEEVPGYALHVTGKHTEITSGYIAVRMTHSDQNEFEFSPRSSLDVCLHPDDAINIASSLGKEDGVHAVIPSDDGETVQVEFESGEIRILQPAQIKFPDINAFQPSGKPKFSVAIIPELLIAALQAFKSREIGSVLLEFRGSSQVISIRPAASANPSDPEVSALVLPIRAEDVIDIAPQEKKAARTPKIEGGADQGLIV